MKYNLLYYRVTIIPLLHYSHTAIHLYTLTQFIFMQCFTDISTRTLQDNTYSILSWLRNTLFNIRYNPLTNEYNKPVLTLRQLIVLRFEQKMYANTYNEKYITLLTVNCAINRPIRIVAIYIILVNSLNMVTYIYKVHIVSFFRHNVR